MEFYQEVIHAQILPYINLMWGVASLIATAYYFRNKGKYRWFLLSVLPIILYTSVISFMLATGSPIHPATLSMLMRPFTGFLILFPALSVLFFMKAGD